MVSWAETSDLEGEETSASLRPGCANTSSTPVGERNLADGARPGEDCCGNKAESQRRASRGLKQTMGRSVDWEKEAAIPACGGRCCESWWWENKSDGKRCSLTRRDKREAGTGDEKGESDRRGGDAEEARRGGAASRRLGLAASEAVLDRCMRCCISARHRIHHGC